MVNQRPGCMYVCVCVLEILGNGSLWLIRALLDALFLKISICITEHLFKVPEPVSLFQEVAFDDIKDPIGRGQHV